MNKIKVSMVGATIVKSPRYPGEALNQPAFVADFVGSSRGMAFPGTTELFETLGLGNLIGNDERMSSGRAAARGSVSGNGERIDTQTLQMMGTVPFIHGAKNGQAKIKQVLDDFLPADARVGFQEIIFRVFS